MMRIWLGYCVLGLVGVVLTGCGQQPISHTTNPLEEDREVEANSVTPVSKMEASSAKNLFDLAVAMRAHDDVYRVVPAARIVNDEGEDLLSWRVRLLPFLGAMELYNEFHLDEAWDSDHNKRLVERMPEVFRRPGTPRRPGMTSYQAVRVEGAMLDYEDRVMSHDGKFGFQPIKYKVSFRMLQTFDGPATTVLLVETPDDLAVVWTKPDDYTPPEANPIKPLLGPYDGFFLAVTCDASVHRFRGTIPADVFRALVTYNGHEELTEQDLANAILPR